MGDQVEKDAVHELAEDLLCKNWVESRPAIMGRQRVEIFRGKDLVSYLVDHSEAVERALPKQKGSRNDLARDVGRLLLKRGIICRSERLFKRPKLGRKKLTSADATTSCAPSLRSGEWPLPPTRTGASGE